MPPVGFETAIPGSERPQTYALDRAATGIGSWFYYKEFNTMHGRHMNVKFVYFLFDNL